MSTAAVRALHTRRDNPTHGCCAAPRLCQGHPAECTAKDHGLQRPTWPCETLRALDTPDPAAPEPGADLPFVVEAVVEQHPDGTDSHHVRATLTDAAWRNLVGDIARAMLRARSAGQATTAKLYGAGYPVNDRHRMDALTDLVRSLQSVGQGPASWLLTADDQTDALAEALDVAQAIPSACWSCGRWIEQPSSLDVSTGCARCHERRGPVTAARPWPIVEMMPVPLTRTDYRRRRPTEPHSGPSTWRKRCRTRSSGSGFSTPTQPSRSWSLTR